MKTIDVEGAEQFRERVQRFLSKELPPDWKGMGALDGRARDSFVRSWRTKLYEARLLAPEWPCEYGGADLSLVERVILHEAFATAGVPTGGSNDTFGIGMLGPVLLQWGTEQQKAQFLPRVLSGEDLWCQGFSEPNAGSDLANIACAAELGDDGLWHLNGQKIWTSNAHLANWIFVLARTSRSGRRHDGITFFLVPMNQPGLVVRPVPMLSGISEFNEVFFDDARTSPENVVGEVGRGWSVAMTLLGHERNDLTSALTIRLAREFDRLIGLARRKGLASDAVIRQELAARYSEIEILRYLGLRTFSAAVGGSSVPPVASLTKLYWSEYHRRVTEQALRILGAEAMVLSSDRVVGLPGPDDAGAPNDSSSWIGAFYNSRAGTIYAGTSEVQRTIIAERILGLPRS